MDSIEELPKRIIKFRAWDTREGLSQMYFLNGFIQYGEGWTGGNSKHKFYEIHYGNGGFNKVSADEILLMQFTGMMDKRKVEIYEGDIIAYDLLEGLGLPARKGLKRVVKITPLGAIGQWDTNIEVLGNIFQNPDLL